MTLEKLSWKSIIPCCSMVDGKVARSKKQARKQVSFQRLTLLDFDDPSSPLSADELSNSFIGSRLINFTFTDLREVTHHFSSANFLGEGGFGRVYKGFVDEKLRPGLKSQVVAVKILDTDGLQGHKEWLVSYFSLFLFVCVHAKFLRNSTKTCLIKWKSLDCEDSYNRNLIRIEV